MVSVSEDSENKNNFLKLNVNVTLSPGLVDQTTKDNEHPFEKHQVLVYQVCTHM